MPLIFATQWHASLITQEYPAIITPEYTSLPVWHASKASCHYLLQTEGLPTYYPAGHSYLKTRKLYIYLFFFDKKHYRKTILTKTKIKEIIIYPFRQEKNTQHK